MDKSNPNPTALYIHVPFCQRKCNYCDFVSYPYNLSDAKRYVQGIGQELALWAQQFATPLQLATVFMGGGTPTCLSTNALMEIITVIKRHFILLPQTEFTIEANPNTVDEDKLNFLRQAGVNRLSLGAQACTSKTLALLGRLHSHGQTVNTVQKARKAGFTNINLDLIFGVPGQTLTDWRYCLEQILTLEPEHISAYGLQIEPHTPLANMVDSGQLTPCDEETELDMYQATADILAKAGLSRYEISNYAKPDHQCRHNITYWRNLPYIGAGPAAHSFVGGRRLANLPDLDSYCYQLEQKSLPLESQEQVTLENEIFETVFLNLRLIEGLNLKQFERRFGHTLEYFYPGVAETLINQSLLKNVGSRLALTNRGLSLANVVMSAFVPLTKS